MTLLELYQLIGTAALYGCVALGLLASADIMRGAQ